MNNKLLGITAFFTLLLISCGGPTEQELAESHLTKAKIYLNNNAYTNAKFQIDTIRNLYPSQKKILAEGVVLLNTVEIQEQKASLAYFDSTYNARQEQFNKLEKDFILKPSGLYVHKKQDVNKNYNRTYVKAYLNKNGTFYIASKYFGKSFINHNRIKVYDSGLFAETNAIPDNGIDNRKLEADGDKWETVNYRNGEDNGVVNFIVNNYDKRLKVHYKGKKHHFIVMENHDKTAIRDAFFLSKLITEIEQLKKDISNSKKRIKILEEEMSSFQTSTIQ